LIVLTGKVFASSRIPIKSFTDSSIMGNSKVKVNFISQQGIIIWASSGSIRKKEEVYILGLANRATFTKENSRQERGMVKERFGGAMVVGMKETLEMEFKVDGVFSIVREESDSMKETGITACLMVKGPNNTKTANATKAPSKRINSTVKEFSTKMTQ
jgi:hypothetical protein